MKNMNRLTRICGLKRRHCLHELIGSMMAEVQRQIGFAPPSCWIKCMSLTMGKRYITILRLSIITLQHDKVKDCDRHPPQYVRVQIGKPGKVCLNAKGARPRWQTSWRSVRSSLRWGKPITWWRSWRKYVTRKGNLRRTLQDRSNVSKPHCGT